MKKKHKLALTLAVLTLFLAACSTTPVTAESTGIWDRVIIYNFISIYYYFIEYIWK